MTRQRRTPKKIKPIEDLKIVHPHAAGLDIGSREIWACVPSASTAENVRVFGTFTVDLQALADWLVACALGLAHGDVNLCTLKRMLEAGLEAAIPIALPSPMAEALIFARPPEELAAAITGGETWN